MGSNHTAGPWKVENIGIRSESIIVTGPGNCLIASISDEGEPEDNLDNAFLISAAPDLLAALKEVVALSDRKHDAWDKAKAAIALAEGKIK